MTDEEIGILHFALRVHIARLEDEIARKTATSETDNAEEYNENSDDQTED